MTFGDTHVPSVQAVIDDTSLASIIYPYGHNLPANSVDTATRVQLLSQYPDSPYLELLSRFISERELISFTAEVMILTEWEFDENNVVTSCLRTYGNLDFYCNFVYRKPQFKVLLSAILMIPMWFIFMSQSVVISELMWK